MSDHVMCRECAKFRHGYGSRMALGRCTGKSWDGHEGQWPYRKHPCGSFSAREEESAGHAGCAEETAGEEGHDARFYVDVLKSEKCVCGREKNLRGSGKGMAFCIRCFNSLPRELRAALWRPLGKGFEEAYDEAESILGKGGHCGEGS